MRSGIRENAVGGLALRILFCGTDRECSAMRGIAATASPGIDLVTSSACRAPNDIIWPPGRRAPRPPGIDVGRCSASPAPNDLLRPPGGRRAAGRGRHRDPVVAGVERA